VNASLQEVFSILFGCLAGLVGLFYLGTRIDSLRWSKYRADYVLMHMSVGAGCMTVSVCFLTDTLDLLWIVAVAIVTVAICHLSVTSKGHEMWRPPDYMRSNTQDKDIKDSGGDHND
jgi:hypothetical protein